MASLFTHPIIPLTVGVIIGRRRLPLRYWMLGAVASIAALAIADARDRVLLTRAVRKAKRATAKLEETLMSEGLQKFADPHKSLIKLIGEKRKSLQS